jgi:hypothetical protein
MAYSWRMLSNCQWILAVFYAQQLTTSSSSARTYSRMASMVGMSPRSDQPFHFAFSITFQPHGFGVLHGPTVAC